MAGRLAEAGHRYKTKIETEKWIFFSFFVVRVLLVEAGGNKPWIGSVPGLVALLQKSPVDWAYTTEVRKLTSSFVECCHFAHTHST